MVPLGMVSPVYAKISHYGHGCAPSTARLTRLLFAAYQIDTITTSHTTEMSFSAPLSSSPPPTRSGETLSSDVAEADALCDEIQTLHLQSTLTAIPGDLPPPTEFEKLDPCPSWPQQLMQWYVALLHRKKCCSTF